MTKCYLFFSIILLFFACKNEPKTATPAEVEVPVLTAYLQCETTEDADETLPLSEVFLRLGEYKLKIGSLLNCAEIDTASYQNYQIPSNALSAAGGWWAGAGDYFYVVKDSDHFVVKQGQMAEEKSADDYDYRTISTFSKTGKPIYSKNELLGTYTLGTHDEAWIFTLELAEGKNWVATMYEIDGMLPPYSEIERFLADFKMTKLKKFEVNMDDLTFDSDFGEGIFERMSGSENITFLEKKWLLETPFVMEKVIQ